MADVILWVEDSPEDSLLDFIEPTIKRKGCEPVLAKGASQLAYALDEIKSKEQKLKGIILDMMLYGSDDLSAFSYPEVKISRATSINMGELLLKYVFRNTLDDGKDIWWKDLTENTPVLILSVRPDLSDYQFHLYGQNIDIIHKYDNEQVQDKWKEDVIIWINNVKGK